MTSPIVVEKMALPEDELVPSVVPPFEFEERFDAAGFHRWFRARWWWSAVFSAAYVLLVFGGRRLMRHREPFRLRLPLVLWNCGLAVFSTLGALRVNSTLFHIILQKGFLFSVCEPLLLTGPGTGFWAAAYSVSKPPTPSARYVSMEVFSVCEPLLLTGPVTGFWAAAYSVSKVVEFGDTFFIVLRKQPLILLHWYHHVSVCMFNWYAYADLAGPVGYFVAMNYTVHAVMYTYFAIRAAGYRLPKKLSMAITVLQSSQMVGGLLIGAYAHVTYRSGQACHWSEFASLLCVMMYGSYLLLFLHFFAKSYVFKTPRPKKE
ncbi:ELOVL6 [Branchiostoma lanceolatum]|uniref:Elongation of very long chain fatty acids protein n=1 Tax=Branchiostoma lanceolatum TaxID=7740 RepID=A0A8K0F2P8_BRALA|nr:ELOVL6 [Branchiostoma lanceolatum]